MPEGYRKQSNLDQRDSHSMSFGPFRLPAKQRLLLERDRPVCLALGVGYRAPRALVSLA